MSKSLRPPIRHLMVVNRKPNQVGQRVLALGRIRPTSCSNCLGERRVTVEQDGLPVSVTCPVCSLRALDTVAVAR